MIETAIANAGVTTPPAGTCLLCHAVNDTVTYEALVAGLFWRCARCGQMWDGPRLATAAAYAQYVTTEQASTSAR